MAQRFVSSCPVCGSDMAVTRLSCCRCDTRIESSLKIPPFFRMPDELQQFVMVFLRCRGSIRDVEKELGISYPTVCKRLDLVNELIGNKKVASPTVRHEILERLERGEITAKEASALLKGR